MMKDRRDGLNWRTWTFNCTLGEMLGIGLAATFVATIAGNFEEPMTLTTRLLILASMVVAGVIEGSILGFFQWRALRNLFPSFFSLEPRPGFYLELHSE
jgi:hypothetical protein